MDIIHGVAPSRVSIYDYNIVYPPWFRYYSGGIATGGSQFIAHSLFTGVSSLPAKSQISSSLQIKMGEGESDAIWREVMPRGRIRSHSACMRYHGDASLQCLYVVAGSSSNLFHNSLA